MGACEFTRESIFVRDILCFFRVSVSAVPCVDLAKLSTKSAQHSLARARFTLQEHFWKIRLAQCVPACSASSSSQKNDKKLACSDQPRICVVGSALLSEPWSICCDAPALQVCSWRLLHALQQHWVAEAAEELAGRQLKAQPEKQ